MATEHHTRQPGSVNLATVKATLDRQVSELRALTASPGERAWLAQIAMQAIVHGLAEGVAS